MRIACMICHCIHNKKEVFNLANPAVLLLLVCSLESRRVFLNQLIEAVVYVGYILGAYCKRFRCENGAKLRS
jgi:hypothetical protein